MKKKIALIVLILLIFLSPKQIYASTGLLGSSSRLYFLVSFAESVRLFLTFPKDQKINYLLELTDKRVSEMNTDPSSAVATRYQEHFQKLEELTTQVSNKQQVSGEIKETSLRQQETLAKVYSQVPNQAKAAILNAQEKSSKHVASTVETIEGPQKAQEYTQQAAQIQQAEQVGQIEQVPMEGSPNVNPGEFTPKGLNQQNQLNPINPGSTNENGGDNSQMQQTQPIQMNQPAGQN